MGNFYYHVREHAVYRPKLVANTLQALKPGPLQDALSAAILQPSAWESTVYHLNPGEVELKPHGLWYIAKRIPSVDDNLDDFGECHWST